ncbi:MAG: TRAP transporter small permease [Clostridiales Family XIII bacterium]|nr:TRAP transporter small permease [Clostridiales Family XIII bacterium]
MSVFVKTLKTIARALIYVSYAAIVVMAVMTVVDVIMRFVFSKPNSGVTEWSQILLIVAMTAMAHSLVEGRFISVGTLVDAFPKRANFAVEIIMGALSLIFFLVVGWQLIKMVGMSMSFHETYFVIKTPRWPMYAILGISFLSSALGTIVYVIERIQNYSPPGDKTVFDENPDLAILALSGEPVDAIDMNMEDEGGTVQ